MSSKKQKLSSKSSRANEEPSPAYDHDKFVNESVASSLPIAPSLRRRDSNFPTIFSAKLYLGKGGVHYAKPRGRLLVREFYAKLVAHVLKKVHVHGVLVDFSAKSINRYYNNELVNLGL